MNELKAGDYLYGYGALYMATSMDSSVISMTHISSNMTMWCFRIAAETHMRRVTDADELAVLILAGN